MSQSQHDVSHWEAQVADKELLASLDKDILSWTQQINWMQKALKEEKWKRVVIDTTGLDSLKSKIMEEVGLGVKHAK